MTGSVIRFGVAVLVAAAAGGTVVASAMSKPRVQDEHANHAAAPAGAASMNVSAAQQGTIPPSEADAMAKLNASPRHQEWVMIQAGKNPVTGANDSTRAYMVFPQRADKAPVVIVIHEIYGLTPWVRAVADQLAADGFIAIAPDFITMKGLPGDPVNGPDRQQAGTVIRTLTNEEINRQIDAAAKFGMAHPSAAQKYGVVGYCWGGAASFSHAVHSPTLGAAVVYYGTSPAPAQLSSVRAPVLGLYAENDNRVNATIAPADSALKAMGKTFTQHIYPGAGHGFLRQSTPGNVEASMKAWPLTVQFFKTHLEAK